MPKLETRLTDAAARKLPVPESGYAIYWCRDQAGFGCRVTSAGSRSWVMEREVDGKNVRRTVGKASGAKSISAEAARAIRLDVSSELQQGKDRLKERRAEAERRKAEAVTLEDALQDYVDGKRRAKDGLGLKERTQRDYLAMVSPGREKADGSFTQGGSLLSLADTSIYAITGDAIRTLHSELRDERGDRQATYAMQVLRAVLNFHGIDVPDNPLARTTAGKRRIVLAGTQGNPRPIPPEYLGAWWRAACAAGTDAVGGSVEAGDYYRFQLLTGTRGVEVLGDSYGNEPIRVRDVDVVAHRVVLKDTKNRRDHTLLLSAQAFEIVRRRMVDKLPAAPLFQLQDPRKTLHAINEAAGLRGDLAITGHDLRATFASVAEEIVSSYTLKAMMNHARSGDVTGAHYVGKSEAQLRAGWQAVADCIEQKAAQSELSSNAA